MYDGFNLMGGVAGVSYLYALVDPAATTADVNRGNNTANRQILVTTAVKPDLQIGAEDIAVTPASPLEGDTLNISATIHNRGSQTGTIKVALYDGSPTAGGIKRAETIIPRIITQGGSATATFALNTIGLNGSHALYLRIDPDNTIDESDKTNNQASRSVTIAAAGLTLSIVTNKGAYSANENIQTAVSLTELNGTARSLTYDLLILDAKGVQSTSIAETSLPLRANANLNFSIPWNSGATYAGLYTVMVRIKENSRIIAKATAAITITPVKTTNARIVVDKTTYRANEQVAISATITGTSPNYIFNDLNAKTSVLDSTGQVLFTTARSIPSLANGQRVELKSYWNTGTNPSGAYPVTLQILDGTTVLSSANTTFTLAGSAATGDGLSGTVSTPQTAVEAGSDASLAYTITNKGNQDLVSFGLNLLVADPATSQLLKTLDAGSGLSLAMTGSKTGSVSFVTTGIAPKTLLAILQYSFQGTVKSLASATFIVKDSIPPVTMITVGAPKYETPGKVFITAGTVFTLTATDDASGVAKTEYRIDGGIWTGYVPFNIATEGSHLVEYRSTDRAGNVEITKIQNVILDKTPPKTVIAGSDPLVEGVVNTISPLTSFTLSATDNISGVKGIWYRIDGGQWQLFTTGFTLAGLKEGAHTITFSAVDNVGNEEPEHAIIVRLILLEVTKGISAEPLVLMAPREKEDRGEDKSKEKYVADPLLSILDSLGIRYYAAKDEDDFEMTLRSGRYNIYLLTADRKVEAKKELREGVYFGDGLLVIKARPDNDNEEDDVAGVKFTGRTAARDLTVTLTESPFSKAATFPSSGKTVIAKVTSASARVYGAVADKRGSYPAVVFNEYGRGKVMLFTFDLLAIADQAKRAELLASALALVNPNAHYLRPLDTVPIGIKVRNFAEPLDLEVTETIPVETAADLPTPPGVSSGKFITWNHYLGALETARFGYYLNLPDAKGEYTATTDVRYANYSKYRLYSGYDLTLKVENTSAELLQGLITDLIGFTATDKRDRKLITEALSELHQVRQNAATAEEAKDNLEKLTETAENIAKLTINCREVRLKLDELIKAWQRKWYMLKLVEKKERKDD